MHIHVNLSSLSTYLALAFGILAVSTASPLIRFAQREAPSLVIAAYRLTLASLMLMPYTLTRHRKEMKGIPKNAFALVTLSGVFLALHFASWITSLEYTTVASSVVLVTTAPLWVAVLSPLFLREKPALFVVMGLLVALVGGMVVGLSESCRWAGGRLDCASLALFTHGRAFTGNLLALAGAWFAAGYLLIGRKLRPTLSLPVYTFLVYGVASLGLLAMVGGNRLPLTGYPPQTYLLLFGLALVPQLFGHSTFNWALRYLSAAYVSVALLGEPVGSSLLAYIFLGETPAILEVSGGVLILVGIYLASRPERPQSVPAAAGNASPPDLPQKSY